MLINDVGSRYVYENKQISDRIPEKKSDIYVDPAHILPKSADFGG
jgi:hypothetical protein